MHVGVVGEYYNITAVIQPCAFVGSNCNNSKIMHVIENVKKKIILIFTKNLVQSQVSLLG